MSRNDRPFERRPPTPPEVVTHEELQFFSDDELVARFTSIDNDRARVEKMHHDTKEWEVELAYVRREQMIRSKRKQLHDQYIAQLRSELADQFEEMAAVREAERNIDETN